MKKLILTALLITSIFAKADELTIKAEINKELSSKYLAFFELDIKNNTQEWQNLKDKKVSFGANADKNIEVIQGKKLAAYFEYIKAKAKLKGKMDTLFSMGLSMISPMASMGSTAISYTKEDMPEGHLYRNSLIPPGVTVKMFFVISSKNHKDYGYLNSFKFNKQDLEFREAQYSTKKNIVTGDIEDIKFQYIWQSDI
ncbi:MAG: hypothetical protein DRG78_00830 [Epsilonproteobacteria bacterium]|nr:MAG: hypothetical protein DRG78_00830 [Campylobacterota bacterium]